MLHLLARVIGIRDQIITALIHAGLNVTAYGHGWPNGYITPTDVPILFAKARIVLGIGTIDYCTDLYSLKMRDFDGPMSGSMYLTHANPDLFDLYKVGEEIVVYTRVSECVDKAIYYCRHPDERETIAQRGRARAEQEHTWEIRFRAILTALNKYYNYLASD